MDHKLPPIQIGYQTYLADGSDPFGAVRALRGGKRPEIIVNVENSGDFIVPLTAVEAVHCGKVILSATKLDGRLRSAICHAHECEDFPPPSSARHRVVGSAL